MEPVRWQQLRLLYVDAVQLVSSSTRRITFYPSWKTLWHVVTTLPNTNNFGHLFAIKWLNFQWSVGSNYNSQHITAMSSFIGRFGYKSAWFVDSFVWVHTVLLCCTREDYRTVCVRCRVTVFESLGLLHVRSVSKSDEGRYSCVASSEGLHRISPPATLTVVSPPDGLSVSLL